MELKINFELVATDEHNEEVIGRIQAYSLESLEEQLHKIEKAVERYKKMKEEEALIEQIGDEDDEETNEDDEDDDDEDDGLGEVINDDDY